MKKTVFVDSGALIKFKPVEEVGRPSQRTWIDGGQQFMSTLTSILGAKNVIMVMNSDDMINIYLWMKEAGYAVAVMDDFRNLVQEDSVLVVADRSKAARFGGIVVTVDDPIDVDSAVDKVATACLI